MNPLYIALIVAALAAAVFYIHRKYPTLKGAEAAAKTEFATLKADLPDLEADAMAAGQKFLLWLTDKSGELAKVAEANASMAKKDALAAQTMAALTARNAAPNV